MSRAILLIRGIRLKGTRPQTDKRLERVELAGIRSVETGGQWVAFFFFFFLVEKEFV